MFLPIGDSPNPRGFTPWATYALLALNLVVFLVCIPQMLRPADLASPELWQYVQLVSAEERLTAAESLEVARGLTEYDLTIYRYGARPASPTLVSVVASMFLHDGALHLFGNLLFLWIFGDNVERRLGRVNYLFTYLALGLAATGGDFLLRWGSHFPGVGASGAISGLLGAYFVWFPYNRVRLVFFLPPLLLPLLELPARWVLAFYLVVDNFAAFFMEQVTGVSGGVAYGAHIGGFLGGVALAWLWTHTVEARRGLDFKGSDEPAGQLRLARRYLELGMPTAAYQEVAEAIGSPDCPPELQIEGLALLVALNERMASLPSRHAILLSER